MNQLRGRRLVAIGLAALLAVTVLPALSAPVSASAVGGSSGAGTLSSWAYGGEQSRNGTISSGGATISWNATFALVVIFNASNTSNASVQLQEERTEALALEVTGSSASLSFHARLRAVEVDTASVNLTRNATVTLGNGSNVSAWGLENASSRSNASLAESVVGTYQGNQSFSAYLNVSGRSQASVGFTPPLGLLPLTVQPGISWTATALANASSSWTIGFSWAKHTPLQSGSGTADRSGGWNGTALVTVNGHAGAPESGFDDHVARTTIGLTLSGAFGLHDGFLLVPQGFDLFNGGTHAYDEDEVTGSATIFGESLFVTGHHLTVRSVAAARASTRFGVANSSLFTSGGTTGAVGAATVPSVSDASATVLAQPESPGQARAQAYCLRFACSSPASFPLGLLFVGIASLAAVATAAVLLARRGRRRSGALPAPGAGRAAAGPSTIPDGAYGRAPPPTLPNGTGGLPPQGPHGPSP